MSHQSAFDSFSWREAMGAGARGEPETRRRGTVLAELPRGLVFPRKTPRGRWYLLYFPCPGRNGLPTPKSSGGFASSPKNSRIGAPCREEGELPALIRRRSWAKTRMRGRLDARPFRPFPSLHFLQGKRSLERLAPCGGAVFVECLVFLDSLERARRSWEVARNPRLDLVGLGPGRVQGALR